MAYIVESCAVIIQRPNRHRGTIRGKSNAISTKVAPFAVDIHAQLVPTYRDCNLIRIIFIDADMAYIISSCGSIGVTRPNRQRGSIRGKSNTPSTAVVLCFAVNIRAQLVPTCWGYRLIFIDADMTYIIGSCGSIGVRRPNRKCGSICGKSNTISTIVVQSFAVDIRAETVPSHWTKTCQTLIGLLYCFIWIIFIDADMTYIIG